MVTSIAKRNFPSCSLSSQFTASQKLPLLFPNAPLVTTNGLYLDDLQANHLNPTRSQHTKPVTGNQDLETSICSCSFEASGHRSSSSSHQAFASQLSTHHPSPAHFASRLHFALLRLSPCKLALPMMLVHTNILNHDLVTNLCFLINLIQSIVYIKFIQSIVYIKLP